MNLKEALYLLSKFGYYEEDVKSRLAQGASVHNAWEGLKLELEIRWQELNKMLSMSDLEELYPAYKKIMGLTLKSAKKKSEVEAKERHRLENAATNIMGQMAGKTQERMAEVLGHFEEALRREQKKDPDNPRIKDALEKLSRGESPV